MDNKIKNYNFFERNLSSETFDKCVLILNKKYSFLMTESTQVNLSFFRVKDSNQYYDFFSSFKKDNGQFKKVLFIVVDFVDFDNLSIFTEFFLRDIQKAYFKKEMSGLNFVFIALPKQRFLINRHAISDEKLIENSSINLIPKNFYENKSNFTYIPSNGIVLLSVFRYKQYKDIQDGFINEIKGLFKDKGYDCTNKSVDLYLNNRKFFGSYLQKVDNVNVHYNYFSCFLTSKFSPDKDFFYNEMKYNGKNEYTGFLEETKNIKFKYILKKIFIYYINKVE